MHLLISNPGGRLLAKIKPNPREMVTVMASNHRCLTSRVKATLITVTVQDSILMAHLSIGMLVVVQEIKMWT